MFRKTKVCSALMVAFGGSLFIASLPVGAQQTLQRVEITGTNIKRTDTETASPVQVLTREDIEKTGKQSIQEILRTITADGQGSIPTSFSNGFASGFSVTADSGTSSPYWTMTPPCSRLWTSRNCSTGSE